jgi:formate dehydrogenase subunit gamma
VSEDALLQRSRSSKAGSRSRTARRRSSSSPQGREYRGFREEILPWLGGLAILGMLAALAAFYFTKGTIRLNHGEQSGRKILRFNAFERFTHWLTAISFIVLADSGLNYIFGKRSSCR